MEQNNKLIAQFMGLTNHHNDSSMMVTKTPQGNEIVPIDALQYETCWNWLIPVVEKIESLGYVFTIQGGKASFGEMISKPKNYIKDNKLTSTYIAVIEFIKEYNNN